MGRSSILAGALMLAACTSPTPSSDNGPPWQTGPTLPGPRLRSGVTALGQQLVIAGGLTTGAAITQEVDSLDTLTNAWTTLPMAPVAWTDLQVVGIDGTLYLLGGLDGSGTAHGESFALDPNATDWRQLATMPSGLERGAAGIILAPPHVYLVGGAGTSAALATSVGYDLMTDSWAQVPVDLPAPSAYPAAMYRGDGALVVIGGLATLDDSMPLSSVLALPIGAAAWQALAELPTARGDCAYGLVQGQLICAGGQAGGAAVGTVDSYDPNTNTWTAAPDMPSAVAGTQGVAIGQQLFVPGGEGPSTDAPTDTLYVFSPL